MSDQLRHDWWVLSVVLIVLGLMADAAATGWAAVIGYAISASAFLVFTVVRTIRVIRARDTTTKETRDA